MRSFNQCNLYFGLTEMRSSSSNTIAVVDGYAVNSGKGRMDGWEQDSRFHMLTAPDKLQLPRLFIRSDLFSTSLTANENGLAILAEQDLKALYFAWLAKNTEWITGLEKILLDVYDEGRQAGIRKHQAQFKKLLGLTDLFDEDEDEDE